MSISVIGSIVPALHLPTEPTLCKPMNSVPLLALAAMVRVGCSLAPTGAYWHRAWWANEVNGQHIHARAWLVAGWVVASVDLASQIVPFQRARR